MHPDASPSIVRRRAPAEMDATAGSRFPCKSATTEFTNPTRKMGARFASLLTTAHRFGRGAAQQCRSPRPLAPKSCRATGFDVTTLSRVAGVVNCMPERSSACADDQAAPGGSFAVDAVSASSAAASVARPNARRRPLTRAAHLFGFRSEQRKPAGVVTAVPTAAGTADGDDSGPSEHSSIPSTSFLVKQERPRATIDSPSSEPESE
jgi:hypothetical protein